MSSPRVVSWRQAPAPVRALGRWITIVQLVGYTTSLLFVHHTTGMTPAGVASHYRGADSTASEAAIRSIIGTSMETG